MPDLGGTVSVIRDMVELGSFGAIFNRHLERKLVMRQMTRLEP